jgi:hypothetical protein
VADDNDDDSGFQEDDDNEKPFAGGADAVDRTGRYAKIVAPEP